ncbi:MAG: hypothetical protein U1D30_02105 [Planctomycetota bacterium]
MPERAILSAKTPLPIRICRIPSERTPFEARSTTKVVGLHRGKVTGGLFGPVTTPLWSSGYVNTGTDNTKGAKRRSTNIGMRRRRLLVGNGMQQHLGFEIPLAVVEAD